MNIFATSPSPSCARDLDDIRLRKMLVETAQILSAIGHGPYRVSHAKHPCTVWAGAHEDHLGWLRCYYMELTLSYMERFNHREHLTITKMSQFFDDNPFDVGIAIAAKPVTFQNSARNTATGLDFSHLRDVHLAYRLYLTAKWDRETSLGRRPSWAHIGPPEWYIPGSSMVGSK